jgi:desulfoferrodoxin-like iron-binding protein
MNLFVCAVCGHIEFRSAPDKCPVCGAPKEKFKQNDRVFIEAEEKAKEGAVKHVPVINVNKQCGLIPEQACMDVIIRVGKTLHPMEEAHHIVWIDCYVDDQYVARTMLTPAVNPAVILHLKKIGAKVRAVELCNLHGHWQAEAAI